MLQGASFFFGNFTELYNPYVMIMTVDNYVTFVDDSANWMTLCDMGGFLGRLDLAVETLAGLTNLLYRIILNFTGFETEFKKL